MNEIGPRIRYWRKLRGLTQEELAGKVQLERHILTRDVIANIETQRSSVPDRLVLIFAVVLKVDVLDLFPPSHPLLRRLQAKPQVS